MSEAKHSPEPWRRGEEHETAVELLSAEPHGVICRVTGNILYLRAPEIQANARRIVACVNACAGIPTEALEAGALDATLNDAVWVLHSSDPTPPDGADAWVALMNGLRALGRAK